MKQLQYQTKYVGQLVSASKDYLEDPYAESKVIIFQAPTGSGKTIMVSKAMVDIVKQFKDKSDIAFIWISVNDLHEQSRSSLEKYLSEERLLECISIDEIDNSRISGNQILFANWESLNKKDNIFMQDNERNLNLNSVVENTKEDGCEIILIIDESHRAAKTDKAKEIIGVINPKLTIEVTATPKSDATCDRKIEIYLPEVIKEEMIKQEVQINPGLSKAQTNEDILKIALKKRQQLKRDYEAEGSNVNPLLLIQIPRKKPADTIPPEDYVIELLKKDAITTDNGRLAIKLSEVDKKVNLELIEKNDNSVEVLIFKESIAVGWDCPRAAILFLQREWNSENYIFNIQTLGRIMRMPEHRHYYAHPELNIGYVYTASDNFEIVKELADNYATTRTMQRDNQKYKNLLLTSELIRRKREVFDLSGEFRECLKQAADELGIKDKIVLGTARLNKAVGINGKIDAIDVEQSVKFKEKTKIIKDRVEIAKEYSDFCAEMTIPFTKARSTRIIKSSIRSLFKDHYEEGNEDKIAEIVINPTNKGEIRRAIEKAKEYYKEMPVRSDEVIANENWQVPESVSIFIDAEEIIHIEKSILKPFSVKINKNKKIEWSKPEKEFIEKLEETDDDVLWWFKNGASESKYFGIAYEKNSGHYGFYPDFIIKTKKESLIIEIKDNKDFKFDNLLKLNAGKDYLIRYKDSFKEGVFFFIISPNDFDAFFNYLKEQNLGTFTSTYENNLRRYLKSQHVISEAKEEKTPADKEILELYDELEKALKTIEDKNLLTELLQMELKQAQENIKALTSVMPYEKESKLVPADLNIPKPFNICVLGEVSDENELMSELQKCFTKYGVRATDWDIDFIGNDKLSNTNIFKSLKKGQSKYTIIITGQIYHHSGKGNKKSNLFTELKQPRYVDHIVGCNPQHLLTTENLLDKLEQYLLEK
ncbi:MAG: DEAD/DEAH box helicase [Nitrospirae bacterium]|nr:MAG: DEAD/DEAH box helicase [Nitrospirota bacterium]